MKRCAINILSEAGSGARIFLNTNTERGQDLAGENRSGARIMNIGLF